MNSRRVGLESIARSFPLVFAPAGEKGPRKRNWQSSRLSPEQVAEIGERNIGVILDPERIVDFDCDGPNAQDSYQRLFGGNPPQTPGHRSKRGCHHFHAGDFRLTTLPSKFYLEGFPELEIRIGPGQQSLIPPSCTDGFTREWIISLADMPLAPIPDTVIETILANVQRKANANLASTADPWFDELYAGARDKRIAQLSKYFARHKIPATYADGKFTFAFCPLRGPQHIDGACAVFVNVDGSFGLNCFHTKCQGKRFEDLEAIHGMLYPVIKIDHNLPRIVREAMDALSNAYVMQHGCLVQLAPPPPKPPLSLVENGSPQLKIVEPPTLKVHMAESAVWKKKTRGKFRPCDPPNDVVQAIYKSAEFPGIPTVNGLTHAPILRSDGTIWQTMGLDPATGLYLVDDIAWPSLMTNDAAVARIGDVLYDFPFATPSDKAAFYAMATTMICRGAIEGPTPFFLVGANSSRVGKGLLTDVVTLIVEGLLAARHTGALSDEEMSKVLTSVVLSGVPYLIFDNIKGKFGGPAIEGAILGGRHSGRILAQSRTVDLPFQLVTI